MSIDAMKQALEALEYALPFDGANGGIGGAIADLNAAIEAAKKQDGWVLREVLFDEGEPIAHREPAPVQEPEFECPRCGHCCPQRQLVDLTDDEIIEIEEHSPDKRWAIIFTQDKLKKKNIG